MEMQVWRFKYRDASIEMIVNASLARAVPRTEAKGNKSIFPIQILFLFLAFLLRFRDPKFSRTPAELQLNSEN